MDKEAVEKVLEKYGSGYGGKLSPILNNMLKRWNEETVSLPKQIKRSEELIKRMEELIKKIKEEKKA